MNTANEFATCTDGGGGGHPPPATARRRPHTAGKADRLNPHAAVIATWASDEAAVAASRATLNAADPKAAMEADLRAMHAAWQYKRAKLLRGEGAVALPSGTIIIRNCSCRDGCCGEDHEVDAAQVLLGKASFEGDVEGMQRAVAAGADVHASVYNGNGLMEGRICFGGRRPRTPPCYPRPSTRLRCCGTRPRARPHPPPPRAASPPRHPPCSPFPGAPAPHRPRNHIVRSCRSATPRRRRRAAAWPG